KPEIEETTNHYRKQDRLQGIFFSSPSLDWKHLHFGTAALTTDWENTDVQTHLYRGAWFDHAHILWDEFAQTGRLTPLLEPIHVKPSDENRLKKKWESGALCLHANLAPGEAHTFQVFIHWHFPYGQLWSGDVVNQVRTYIANQFVDAWDAAMY